MKKILFTVTAIAATSLAAQAQTTIASWAFEPDPLTVALTNATFPLSGSYAADNGGSGQLTAVHASNNTIWTSPSGNGSANALSSDKWTIGDYFQFRFSTLTFSNIAMSWSQTRSGTGPTNFSMRYSIDGTAFTVFTNYSVSQVTWNATSNNLASVFTADLSGITEINDQPDVFFRLVSEQTTASAGTARIDNITIVPEPSTYTMLALAGAGFAGYVIRRRRR